MQPQYHAEADIQQHTHLIQQRTHLTLPTTGGRLYGSSVGEGGGVGYSGQAEASSEYQVAGHENAADAMDGWMLSTGSVDGSMWSRDARDGIDATHASILSTDIRESTDGREDTDARDVSVLSQQGSIYTAPPSSGHDARVFRQGDGDWSSQGGYQREPHQAVGSDMGRDVSQDLSDMSRDVNRGGQQVSQDTSQDVNEDMSPPPTYEEALPSYEDYATNSEAVQVNASVNVEANESVNVHQAVYAANGDVAGSHHSMSQVLPDLHSQIDATVGMSGNDEMKRQAAAAAASIYSQSSDSSIYCQSTEPSIYSQPPVPLETPTHLHPRDDAQAPTNNGHGSMYEHHTEPETPLYSHSAATFSSPEPSLLNTQSASIYSEHDAHAATIEANAQEQAATAAVAAAAAAARDAENLRQAEVEWARVAAEETRGRVCVCGEGDMLV